MEKQEIIQGMKQYFKVHELVCNHTHDRFGESSWMFLDTDYLHAILVIRRDILKLPMICNNGAAKQRGLRCHMCDIVKGKKSVYLSGHVLGKAGDFTVVGMSAEDARKKIKTNAHLLPCNIRLEVGVDWLHIDTIQMVGVTKKVYEFRA